MNFFRFLKHINRALAAVALFSVILLTLFWVAIIHHLGVSRQKAIDAAVRRNSNLAVTLEQYAFRTLRNADALLQLVRYEYAKTGRAIDLNSLLKQGVIDPQWVAGVSIIDSNGRMQISNKILPEGNTLDVSDREHFWFHKTARDTLYLSTPIRSRMLGTDVLVLSRRINRADGSFGGTVAVQIEPNALTRFYADANLNTNDLISLIAPNGITYARRTGDRESYGEDISKSPLFKHLAEGPVGSYYARDAIHGIPTWFSFRRLSGYPVIATVGTAEANVLAEYRATARREYAFAGGISLLLLLFSATVYAVLQQRRNNVRAVQEAEQRRRQEQEHYQRRLTQQIIAAQELERERIGRELHDNVNQVLTTVKLNLELAQGDPLLAGRLLPRSVSYLQECISDIRDLSRELSAPTLGTSSLIDSIGALVDMVTASSGLFIIFNNDSYQYNLPKEQKLAFYRILQEGLNNIVKHAGATQVSIELEQDEAFTWLHITDNGKGFQPGGKHTGIGLMNMRSRATVLGGTFSLQSAPGKGCRITVRLQLPAPGED